MLTFVVTVYFVVLAFLVFGDGYNIKVLFKTFDSVYFVMVQVLYFSLFLFCFKTSRGFSRVDRQRVSRRGAINRVGAGAFVPFSFGSSIEFLTRSMFGVWLMPVVT